VTTSAKAAPGRKKPNRGGGPKTAAGKARSRQNSWKHGLSTPLKFEDIPSQATLLVSQLSELISSSPENVELLAMAQLECMRIQQAKVDVINRILQEPLESGDEARDQSQRARAIINALPLLASFIPYESRADSRMRTALRRLDQKSKHDAHGSSPGLPGVKGQ
jgi:hypothetical protein